MIWILFEQFCASLHFSPYIYTNLQIGPAAEETTDDQDYQETQEYFEEPSGSRPSTTWILITYCLLELLLLYFVCEMNLHGQFV